MASRMCSRWPKLLTPMLSSFDVSSFSSIAPSTLLSLPGPVAVREGLPRMGSPQRATTMGAFRKRGTPFSDRKQEQDEGSPGPRMSLWGQN